MFMHARFAVLAAALLAHGCAMPAREAANWPSQLPPRQHFERIHAADADNARVQSREQYLTWVRRYYEGSELFALGYLDLVAQVVAGMDVNAAHVLKRKLDATGRQIGGEWAKDRRFARIRTRTLAAWGEALRAGVAAGDAESVVDGIRADVAAILSGKLAASAITAARYGNPAGLAHAGGCDDPSAAFDERCLVAEQ